MPDTVLDVQKVHTDWVVLLEDERLLVIDEESKRDYIDIRNMGRPNKLDCSAPCFIDHPEWGELVTLSRKPQYSTFRPYVLVTEHSEENRHLAIFNIRDRKMIFHERMRDIDDEERDALLEWPYLGSAVSPTCETIFRTLAPVCSTEVPTIIIFHMERWNNQEPCRLVYITHRILHDEVNFHEYAFNDMQNLQNSYVFIERQVLYDDDSEIFILMNKSVEIVAPLTSGEMVTLEINVATHDDGFDGSSSAPVSLSTYCSELCKSKLRYDSTRRPQADFFITDVAVQTDYSPLWEDNRLICCFIGGSHGIIYVADLLLWRTIPSLYIAVMMVENITFDLLQYNGRHSILIARGTKGNGRSKWYLFDMKGIVKRMSVQERIENTDEDRFPTVESIRQISKRARNDLVDYMVVPSSVFDFGPDVRGCFMNLECTTLQIATLQSYESITYAKGSLLDKKIRVMKSAMRHPTPTCKISRILTEELVLEILKVVSQDATIDDRWNQLQSRTSGC